MSTKRKRSNGATSAHTVSLLGPMATQTCSSITNTSIQAFHDHEQPEQPDSEADIVPLCRYYWSVCLLCDCQRYTQHSATPLRPTSAGALGCTLSIEHLAEGFFTTHTTTRTAAVIHSSLLPLCCGFFNFAGEFWTFPLRSVLFNTYPNLFYNLFYHELQISYSTVSFCR